jgi:flagellar export protein FliJ
MAIFKFKLEPVLKQRKNREDATLAAFGSAQRALQLAKDHKDSLLQSLEGALLRRESLGTVATGIHDFQVVQDYIGGTKQRIIQSEQGIVRAQRGVEKAMRAYLQARRQTRAIEILRERALEEFKRDQSKQEQKNLDDLIIMRSRLVSPMGSLQDDGVDGGRS